MQCRQPADAIILQVWLACLLQESGLGALRKIDLADIKTPKQS